ncbi:hypothetical protein AB0E00_24710 [Streptomyces sp. NPDC048110]|uniref:hypothetical protein n=1 Tax=Streptomyces sp. NPDC048110 TaxID=3155483 RepID=UPI0033F0D263
MTISRRNNLFARLLAVATALTSLAVAPSAWAAPDADASTSVTWSMRPADENGADGRAWIEQKLDPGTSVTNYALIRNLGDIDTKFQLTAADGYFTDTGRFNMLPAETGSTGAGTWIDLPASVVVEAHGTEIVPFTVTVPDNATPGDHAAGVAASILSNGTDDKGAKIGVVSRVGFRVMTTVTGDTRPDLEIQNVEAKSSISWNPFAPARIEVSYRAANSGNMQLSYVDRLGDGEKNERGDLLPGETRAATVGTSAWPVFRVPVNLALTATGTSPGISADARTTVHVWAVPWPHLAILLAVVLILFALFAGRRRGKARVDRMLEEARDQGRREAACAPIPPTASE